jgi:hypothetical protein
MAASIERLPAPRFSARKINRGLGWFSIALGLAEVLATRGVAGAAGVDKAFLPVLRLFGLREIASGVGLLTARDRKKWVWSRVAGDALDLAFVGYGLFLERRPGARKRLKIAAAVVAPVVVLDVLEAMREAA